MVPSLPSFIIRRALRQGPMRILNGIREVTLTGKIVRRTRSTITLFDSFSGIHTYTNNAKIHEEIDKSIRDDYLVHIVCVVERIPKTRLAIRSIRPATFYEEIYRTTESIEYWKKIQSQKQPK